MDLSRANLVGPIIMRGRMRGATLLLLAAGAAALDAKWTPNGEAPAPFSTKARQQMGVDPASFAGAQKAPTSGGGTLGLSLGMALVVYLTNNWNLVIALQRLIEQLIAPFVDSRRAAAERKDRLATAAAMDSARKARLERLRKSKIASPHEEE